MQPYFMPIVLFFKSYIYSIALKKYFYNFDVQIDWICIELLHIIK